MEILECRYRGTASKKELLVQLRLDEEASKFDTILIAITPQDRKDRILTMCCLREPLSEQKAESASERRRVSVSLPMTVLLERHLRQKTSLRLVVMGWRNGKKYMVLSTPFYVELM